MIENKKSPTDPRILRTRQLIKNALVELLGEMDIKKITVNRLAERATINRVTFYLHYRDIPDMLEKMADDMIEEFSMVIKNTPAVGHTSSGEGNWKILENILEHIAKNGNFYKIILASKQIPIFRDRLLSFLKDMIVTKIDESKSHPYLLSQGIKVDILIWYNSSALIGTIISWLQNDMPYTPAFLTQQFSLLHLRGLNRES
ncbi:TetR/AcrR family transcriptional regulator [Gottfriedia solisilvae]|uniref:TetR family transcriptional regulator n=1 Tax=Gottfriedia solisilvae TaxID=1516104 RepID=A0A8J3ANY2_9BACI|nr:TetR/AcrR family transcriptional regulator [Gottfriedia solisilvae]GGI17363.1 TetR family transcriptional regulator [Gottfriedia solisilvae]